MLLLHTDDFSDNFSQQFSCRCWETWEIRLTFERQRPKTQQSPSTCFWELSEINEWNHHKTAPSNPISGAPEGYEEEGTTKNCWKIEEDHQGCISPCWDLYEGLHQGNQSSFSPIPDSEAGLKQQETTGNKECYSVTFSEWAAAIVHILKQNRPLQICRDCKETNNKINYKITALPYSEISIYTTSWRYQLH